MIPAWLERRLPFEACVGVTLFMASGNVVRFTVQEFRADVNGYGQMVGYEWKLGRNAPLQLEASRVEAVQTAKAWRWKKEW